MKKNIKGIFKNRKARYSVLLGVILVLSIGIAIFTKPEPTLYKTGKTAEIQITGEGFVPSQLSIERGTKVVWINNSGSLRQIGSNPYPTNDGLPGLKSEILNNDQIYEYTFDNSGSFGYHDAMQPTTNGVIEVQ